MIMIRSPSLRRSASGMLRRLPAGDPAEDGSDGHPESREIALPEDVARDGREDGRHELPDRLRIDDDVSDLAGLLGNEPAPDGVSLGPEVLSLVVEADRVLVDDDAEGDGVDARDDPAVELGSAAVDG